MSWEDASFIVQMFGANNLKNIRFSGGEPTMWHVKDKDGNKKNLVDLVKLTKSVGVERIAISTNGSIATKFYQQLVDAGVNDFSISLDSCCSETGDKMAGDKKGAWEKVVKNIEYLSKITYVTVGVVFTPDNVQEFTNLVEYADSLGVADIRILSSAQWNKNFFDIKVDQAFLDKHPILKYRMTHFAGDRHVRGIQEHDSHSCPLMLDDMAILNGYHFPCIIYMRELGMPIGKVDFSLPVDEAIAKVRLERQAWVKANDTHENPICKKNCLDVCIDYNNKVKTLNPHAPQFEQSLSKKVIQLVAV
jgi:MoaA/NifB/PqqE/SkfB family radical SAM enzyme